VNGTAGGESWHLLACRPGARARAELSVGEGQVLERRQGGSWLPVPCQRQGALLRAEGLAAGEYRLARGEALPGRFELLPPVPNPFNPSTVLQLELPVAVEVRLVIYDMLGRQVTVLAAQDLQAGVHRITWNGTNAAGHPGGQR
jgi:hypothetical protein